MKHEHLPEIHLDPQRKEYQDLIEFMRRRNQAIAEGHNEGEFFEENIALLMKYHAHTLKLLADH